MTAPNPNNRRSILSAYVAAKEREPFAWGSNDCVMMVAGAVEAITGVDHAAEFRGRYSSMAAAKRIAGKSLLEFVSDRFEKIHPSEAFDGDIAALRQGREWAFGIFIGPFIYAQTKQGMGILPRSAAKAAFRVP
jgi:hypothetical protein